MRRRDIILEMSMKSTQESAWRNAAVHWMLKNRLIEITAAEKASPCFQAEK